MTKNVLQRANNTSLQRVVRPRTGRADSMPMATPPPCHVSLDKDRWGNNVTLEKDGFGWTFIFSLSPKIQQTDMLILLIHFQSV